MAQNSPHAAVTSPLDTYTYSTSDFVPSKFVKYVIMTYRNWPNRTCVFFGVEGGRARATQQVEKQFSVEGLMCRNKGVKPASFIGDSKFQGYV